MEYLGILEKKIGQLLESAKQDAQQLSELKKESEQLKVENSELLQQLASDDGSVKEEVVTLRKENEDLRKQIEKLEDSLLARHESIEALSQEKELTRMAVDDLIKDIDSIVGSE